MPNDDVLRRLVKVLLLLVGLIAFGTVGYALLEGWSIADSLFMTVITFSTVGYGETNELTHTGRVFTSCLIFMCIVGTTCWTAALTSFIVENDLSGQFLRRRMLKMIANLKNHTIVCGSGPMAQAVVERLVRKRVPVVVIDDNEEQLEVTRRRFRKVMIVEGVATNELVLAKANLLEAVNVVATMESEVDNLLVTITCRDMGRDVAVYARSNDPTIANRLRKAGVREVISPYQLGGERIANLVLA